MAKTPIQYVRLFPGDRLAVKHDTWEHGIFVGRSFRDLTFEHDMVVRCINGVCLTSLREFGGDALIYRIDYDDTVDMARVRRARACVKASRAVDGHDPSVLTHPTNPDQLPHQVSSYLEHKVF